ncbi:uncharacterized protein LOC110739559 [Chenopodium quinoa]|uniref:uncharacterized protein LOC110739559 n=1 Tax=Chenopodium quinoa TaxID=63459 RepID=UPI000B786CE3|nr:uncharacterized protein LOC110739559 [Chenopodium quinoa]
MSFFELVGVTPKNQNFLVGYVFMRNECTESYKWVLQRLRELIGYDKEPSVFFSDCELGLCAAMREVFPGTSHLLFRWHINKDVEARVTDLFKNKKIGASFKNGEWKRTMDATTKADYNIVVNTVKARWASYPSMITYVERTWLCYKIKFVTFWTNQVLHFGNTSNCRVELKANIRSEDVIIAIRNGLEASRSKFGEKYRQLPLSRINGKVSQHSLKILGDETRRMRELSYQLGSYIRKIHPFWKTLVIGDGVDILFFANDSTEEAAHFHSLVDEVIGSDPTILRNVSRIIKEELHQDHANLEEPHVNHNVRGRQRNNDTRGDPCYFEYVNRLNTQRGTQQIGTTSGPMLPYIMELKDVIGDGNYGFRYVADFFFGDQAQWFTARETIANEVAAHPMLYQRIYGIGRVWMNVELIRWDGGAVYMRH